MSWRNIKFLYNALRICGFGLGWTLYRAATRFKGTTAPMMELAHEIDRRLYKRLSLLPSLPPVMRQSTEKAVGVLMDAIRPANAGDLAMAQRHILVRDGWIPVKVLFSENHRSVLLDVLQHLKTPVDGLEDSLARVVGSGLYYNRNTGECMEAATDATLFGALFPTSPLVKISTDTPE